METIFSLSSLLVMPFWLLMIALPHWRWTGRLMRSPLVCAAPALLYLALALPRIGALLAIVTRPTLPGIAAVLGTPAGATLAWAHFLAFDLFVGRWIYLDSRERGISAWIMAPLLFFTLMLGPIGFLGYLAVRAIANARQPRAAGATRVKSA
jgi:ABA4-like protein